MRRSFFNIALIALSWITTQGCLAMERPRQTTPTVRQKLTENGITYDQFVGMIQHVREGYTAESAIEAIDSPVDSIFGNAALAFVQEYLRDKALFAEFGYRFLDTRDGRRGLEFIPLQRTAADSALLRSWGFTDDDIRRLSIANIRDPLNDARLRRGTQTQQGADLGSFYILGSQSIYPTATLASEADLLILTPIYLRIAPASVNAELREFTPLSLMAYNNYLRAARLLLAAPGLNVNATHRIGTPLEVAIEQGHSDMVALLLTHPEIRVTERAVHLAEGKIQIQRLLAHHKAKESAKSGVPVAAVAALCGGNFGTPIPMPHYDNDLLDKYARNFMKKKDGKETLLEKWSPYAVGAALVTAVGYIVKKLLSSEKKDQKTRA